MDKRVNGLGGALREIAEERDGRLRKSGAIPLDRAKQLEAFLAAEFPVEMGLRAVARKRDEALGGAEPALPLAKQTALREQVRFVGTPENSVGRLWGRAGRAAALAAAAVILTAAAVHFARLNSPIDPVINRPDTVSVVDQDQTLLSRDQFLEPSDVHFTLRVRRPELASLESSFLTINRALPDLEQPDGGLLLGLPFRQIRLEVDAVRTP